MKIGTRRLPNGKLLFLVLAFALSGCRTDRPPLMSVICTGDGFGGAECVTHAGAKVYKAPSELKNFWMTTQDDEANFAAWCYDATPDQTKSAMDQIQNKIKGTDERKTK